MDEVLYTGKGELDGLSVPDRKPELPKGVNVDSGTVGPVRIVEELRDGVGMGLSVPDLG